MQTDQQGSGPGLEVLGRAAIALGGLMIAQRALGGASPPASLPKNKPKPSSTAGEGAQTPADIPAPGWKDICWRVYGEISNDRVLAVAAGVTFYVLLAIFPAVTALVSIYGLFADPATIQQHLSSIASFLPGGALDVLGGQIERITSKGHGNLGFALALGLVTSIWSANAGMKALFDALNVAYGEKETRGFIGLNATSLAFTAGMLVFSLLAISAAIVVPILLNFVTLGPSFDMLLRWLRWPVLLVVLGLALALLYRFGPTRKKPKWRWITVGSAFAGLAWIAASAGFSWYAANFGSYNETYGALGAVIGFMTWIWISVIVIMVGAELNSEVEAQAKGSAAET